MTANPMTTSLVMRPRHEGANMRTWIGFKHFLYLAEEAVLHWFRDHGYGVQRLCQPGSPRRSTSMTRCSRR
jgi:trans-aconitate methyltransferase